MTKAEFADQFKRLRVAGYRLPVFDGVTIKDVTDEWYATFASCTVQEFAEAIDRLKREKREKADRFWLETGDVWSYIYEVRKARKIQREAEMPAYDDPLQPDERQAYLGKFREFKQRLLGRMTMPHAEQQVPPVGEQE